MRGSRCSKEVDRCLGQGGGGGGREKEETTIRSCSSELIHASSGQKQPHNVGDQGLSQGSETGCPKLAIVTF